MTTLYWLIGIACVGIVCYFMSEEIIKDDAKELAENPDLAYKEWLKTKERENKKQNEDDDWFDAYIPVGPYIHPSRREDFDR